MYKIIEKQFLTSNIVEMQVFHPLLAKSAKPGQFLIIIAEKNGERIPLTVCDTDPLKGLVTIVFQVVGDSTRIMSGFEVGDCFSDMVGPLGQPSELMNIPLEELKNKQILFIAGGVGTAPVYPQAKWLYELGIPADVMIGSAKKSSLIYTQKMKKVAKNLFIATDDGSAGEKGFVTTLLQKLIDVENKHYDIVVAIGPMIMMKNVACLTKQYDIETIISLNALMVDGTGMCGACRVTVGGQTKFTCVDGPEFNGFEVDFSEAMKRQAMYANAEKRALLEDQEAQENHTCFVGGVTSEQPDRFHRVQARERDPKHRSRTFQEVSYGYNQEEAIEEAKRCLQCNNPMCQNGCPVHINIKKFVHEVSIGAFETAYNTIAESSLLPAICGRVCPQETQCEGNCVLGKKGDPVAIGKLERFVADFNKTIKTKPVVRAEKNKHKVAIVGSGPAGLTCAADLAKKGYEVSIYEALHQPGGVLMYGIPEFRLPKQDVVEPEIQKLKNLGVQIYTNVLIGRTLTVHDLLKKEHYNAVFLASGAGLPKFMNIQGENLNGVVSANEFLTRNNLMRAYKQDFLTPIYVGKHVVVVGGGNVAMDAARTALRLGAEVSIVYRRSETELPARKEEVLHAKEEGIVFHFLTTPVEILGNNDLWVDSIKLRKMELGQPDTSGRRSPIEIENSDYLLKTDMVIMALGTVPNPLIARTTEGLQTDKKGCITADEFCKTSIPGVFAGGDVASGAATVILAMGAGRIAANSIDEYIKGK